MRIILISFVLVMKFTNSFLFSCRSTSYNRLTQPKNEGFEIEYYKNSFK